MNELDGVLTVEIIGLIFMIVAVSILVNAII